MLRVLGFNNFFARMELFLGLNELKNTNKRDGLIPFNRFSQKLIETIYIFK